jgi:hypothetical protein
MQGYDSRETGKPSKQQVGKESGLQMSKAKLVTALKWWIVFAFGILVGMGIFDWIDYVK